MENFVEIVDVGPRDGLQSQPTLVDTETKIEFILRLVDAGIRRLEVASFANPKRVPQMADAEDVIKRLPRDRDAQYIGLVLNRRGFERAVQTGIDQVNCVVVTTDTFNRANQGTSSDETLANVKEIATEARKFNLFCGVTIAAAFGCPYEGLVDPARVVAITEQLVEAGVNEIAIADSIGVAVPSEITSMIKRLSPIVGTIPLRCHFHNTRNTGIANAIAAVEAGVRIIDASCGGVGGCPFAPGATGNIGTEDVIYALERMGFETNICAESVIDTARWLESVLNTKMPAMVTHAGLFPPAPGNGVNS